MKPSWWLLVIALLPSLSSAEDNIPLRGKSLFDQLLMDKTAPTPAVPYPFPSLLDTLRSRIGPTSAEDPIAAVLIPRGRSLHREAARPDYFRFPRVVVALDRHGSGHQLVKNRLFLGYQERAESIEVISYNELAGRFEFQQVENYAAGKDATVTYVNRALCTGCHQNQAPIFPRPLWQETNFNRSVAEKIGAYHDEYQGIGTGIEHAQADRVDFATDQANLLAAYQRVWQRGCPNASCRANLFLALLLRQLESEKLAEYGWLAQERELLDTLEQSWRQTWPQGMPVASGDIDDRVTVAGNDSPNPEQIPLDPREPLSYWSARTATIRTLEGIADQFLPPAYLERLKNLYASRRVDHRQIEMAIKRLQSTPDTAGLFQARPIPGVLLMQELMAMIDVHE